ncbi:protein ALP1-like [Aphis craccivora]|uniref:Protein ALP1-like n=1 Tax=Aphis craccivora TaxID=307492 RepID=A0A6G0Y653_APHCR|nr:protein ALP1-like [Aphis craccivora]
MAVVDVNLNFVFIDVGAYGREADSNIPDPVSLPLTENNLQPFVFVADEAFALHTNSLRVRCSRPKNDKDKMIST